MFLSDHENRWMDLKKYIVETDLPITKESILEEITRLEIEYSPKKPKPRPKIVVKFGKSEPMPRAIGWGK